jgi:hypothetical protein
MDRLISLLDEYFHGETKGPAMLARVKAGLLYTPVFVNPTLSRAARGRDLALREGAGDSAQRACGKRTSTRCPFLRRVEVRPNPFTLGRIADNDTVGTCTLRRDSTVASRARTAGSSCPRS